MLILRLEMVETEKPFCLVQFVLLDESNGQLSQSIAD